MVYNKGVMIIENIVLKIDLVEDWDVNGCMKTDKLENRGAKGWGGGVSGG